MSKQTFKIEMTPDASNPCERASYQTLAAARAAIRKANGGRLYGKFFPEGEAVEGWNLGRRDGCNAAVIVGEHAH